MRRDSQVTKIGEIAEFCWDSSSEIAPDKFSARIIINTNLNGGRGNGNKRWRVTHKSFRRVA